MSQPHIGHTQDQECPHVPICQMHSVNEFKDEKKNEMEIKNQTTISDILTTFRCSFSKTGGSL